MRADNYIIRYNYSTIKKIDFFDCMRVAMHNIKLLNKLIRLSTFYRIICRCIFVFIFAFVFLQGEYCT